MTDALQMLRDDHKKVKDIFKQYEEAEDAKTKQELAKTALMELEIHAELEEEIFYPAVRKESDAEESLMDEADEEHHVAKVLMAELRGMRSGSKMDAKFTVLAENVKHHIDEEESEMLPKAAELGMERMMQLGEAMAARKLQLMTGTTKRKTTTTSKSAAGRSRSRAGTMKRGTGTRTTATARKVRTTARKAVTATKKAGRTVAAKGRAAAARSTNGRSPSAKTAVKRAASTTRAKVGKTATRAKARVRS